MDRVIPVVEMDDETFLIGAAGTNAGAIALHLVRRTRKTAQEFITITSTLPSLTLTLFLRQSQNPYTLATSETRIGVWDCTIMYYLYFALTFLYFVS